jgi:hypothetical protein
MIWKIVSSGSGDQIANLKNDKLRRNALLFLVGVTPTEKTSPGRCSLLYASIAAGPLARSNRLG